MTPNGNRLTPATRQLLRADPDDLHALAARLYALTGYAAGVVAGMIYLYRPGDLAHLTRSQARSVIRRLESLKP